MEWKNWLSLPLTQRTQLPSQSGIYVVVDAEEQVWYVGKTINFNARWNGKGHHRYKQLSRTNNKRSYRIYWQNFPPSQLSEKENKYIDLFKPYLNYSRVKTYARKPIQSNEEISRILKTLNKQTRLFPSVRSVVVGYYTELDTNEDDDASLEEYTCIVIVVNINDYDSVISKSYEKSLSRKGINLKGCWQTYESDCGVEDPTVKPAYIPTFVIDNIVYEFVCYSRLIDKFEVNKSSLDNIEIAKQTVLALKDTGTLMELSIHDGYFDYRSEDYLRYRIPDLQSPFNLTTNLS
jgi:hypothetical protein